MKRAVSVAGCIAAGAVLLVSLIVWDHCGYYPLPEMSGRIDAKIDLAHGRYRELGYGLPPPRMPEYISLLRQRYGVEYDAVAGCTVSKDLVDYVDAYDEVSTAAISRRFGHDIFKEVADETIVVGYQELEAKNKKLASK